MGLWDTIKDIGHTISNGVKSVFQEGKSIVDNTFKTVNHVVDKSSHLIEHTEDTGKDVVNKVVQETSDTVKKGFHEIGDTARKGLGMFEWIAIAGIAGVVLIMMRQDSDTVKSVAQTASSGAAIAL